MELVISLVSSLYNKNTVSEITTIHLNTAVELPHQEHRVPPVMDMIQ
jgi:hypothetical protein